ncbi:hypothetical protein CsatB_011811 [Cannabis sativa]
MANWCQKHEEVTLSKQLAVTVKSIKWSYAIFWSFSTREQGVLEWGAGYYNGDIKSRKIVHSMELETNKTGLQRSVQLRELYMSLSEGETDQQAKTTTSSSAAALSLDDLTDAEWYYLVCMSFVFKPGQSLPSTALEKGQPIWLCNAQYADSNVFSRSLLAKVPEDHNLLQHIKASLLDISKPSCSEKSPRFHQRTNGDDDDYGHDKDQMCVKVDHEELKLNSPDEYSYGCKNDHQPKGLNDGTSQVQGLNLMDDDFSNGVQGSMNSGDYVLLSGALVKQEKDSKSCFAAWNKRGHGNNYRPILLQEMLKSKLFTVHSSTLDGIFSLNLKSKVYLNSCSE